MAANPSSPAWAGYIELFEQSRKPFAGLEPMDLLCAELGAMLAVPVADETLRRAIASALGKGITGDRIESVLLHLAAYAGLGPAERGFAVLQALAPADHLALSDIPADRAGRIERGLDAYRGFHPDRPQLQAPRYAPLSPDYYPSAMELMSHTFADGRLTLRSREVASIACLAALGCCPDQLRFHVEVGLREGISRPQLAGLLMLVQVHAGVPRAHNAAALAAQVISQSSEKA